jgi:hypothetical protein
MHTHVTVVTRVTAIGLTLRRFEGHERLVKDYFVKNLAYDTRLSRDRFRTSKHVFSKLVESVENYDLYFVQKTYAIGELGLSSLQKYIATMCILTYGIASSALDEYVRLALSTFMHSLKQFA